MRIRLLLIVGALLLLSGSSIGQALFEKGYRPVNATLSTSHTPPHADILATPDNGALLFYTINPDGALNPQAAITQVNDTGGVVWSRSYDGNSDLMVRSATRMDNGDLIVVCYINNFVALLPRPFVFCTDASGQEKWAFTNNTFAGSQLMKVLAFGNRLYLVGSAFISSSLKGGMLFISELNPATGAIIWSKSFEYAESVNFQAATIKPDGTIVIAGETKDPSVLANPSSTATVLVETDANANVKQAKILSVANVKETASDIIATSDKGFLLTVTVDHEHVRQIKLTEKLEVSWMTNGHFTELFNTPSNTVEIDPVTFITFGSYVSKFGFLNPNGMRYFISRNGSINESKEFAMGLSKDATMQITRGVKATDNAYYIMAKMLRNTPAATHDIVLRRINSDRQSCEIPTNNIYLKGFSDDEANPVNITADNFNLTNDIMPISSAAMPMDVFTYCIAPDFNCDTTLNLGTDTILCNGNTLELTADVNSGYRIRWNTGDTTAAITVSQSGTYSVMAWAPPIFECDTLYDTIQVTLPPKLNVSIQSSLQEAQAGDTISFQAQPSGATSYAWDFDDGNLATGEQVVHFYERNGEYWVSVVVEDIYGCFYSDSTLIDISGFAYHWPTAFTPNNDGLNDTFLPIGIGIDSYEMTLYNQWGELFLTLNNQPWDGTYKGQQVPEGVYGYLAKVRSQDGQSFAARGLVTLLK